MDQPFQMTSEAQRFLRWVATAPVEDRLDRPHFLKTRAGIETDEPGYLGLLVTLSRAGLIFLPINGMDAVTITPRGRAALDGTSYTPPTLDAWTGADGQPNLSM